MKHTCSIMLTVWAMTAVSWAANAQPTEDVSQEMQGAAPAPASVLPAWEGAAPVGSQSPALTGKLPPLEEQKKRQQEDMDAARDAVEGTRLPTAGGSSDPFKDALTQAYKSNPRLKASRSRLEATNEQVSQALSGFLPSVNANYERGRQHNEYNENVNNYSNRDVRILTVEQPIFRGGRTLAAYSGAKNRVFADRENLRVMEQDVLLDTVTAYMDISQNQQLLELSRENAGAIGRQLDSSQDRFNYGEVTRTDVAQSQSRQALAKANVVQSEGNLNVSLANFERAAGFRPEGPMPIPKDVPELPASLEEAIELAEANNPDYLAATFQAEAADDDVDANKGRLLPSVSLVGRLNRQQGAGITGLDDYNNDMVTVNVAIPIFEAGGTVYSRVREAKGVARQRDYQARDAQQALIERVTRAWQDVETADAVIKERDAQIEASQVALSGVTEEQQYGTRTILDVLDAEQEFFNARVSRVRAERNWLVAVYALEAAIGNLNAGQLGLPVEIYDPVESLDDVKYQFIGF